MKTTGFGENTVDQMLSAAERLLIRIGYRQLSMEDVANESGVNRQTLYLCFRNKGDLVLAREDRITKSVRDSLQRIARRGGPWKEKIRKMLFFRVFLRYNSVQHIPDSIDDILRDIGPDLREREEVYCREESKILSAVLQRERKVAATQSTASSVLAEALVAATNSLLPFHLTNHDLRRRRDAEQKINQVIDVVLSGLSEKSRG